MKTFPGRKWKAIVFRYTSKTHNKASKVKRYWNLLYADRVEGYQWGYIFSEKVTILSTPLISQDISVNQYF